MRLLNPRHEERGQEYPRGWLCWPLKGEHRQFSRCFPLLFCWEIVLALRASDSKKGNEKGERAMA